ncbi:hypothetical protein OH77DRAFT_1589713 [Trametes cingulata]|nr:hypothetical protein OH77DRAFT_1589713 [Trametes cingulata]
MSLSTITTATYELVKYSRAYNHTATDAQSPQAELQWQHFVNTVIRLAMDTRKTSDGTLESYRLRIVWTFSAGLDSMDVDQREVVFEDLDLVTYSSMPSLQAPQGMPLKAVYQDAVVGLRYQHPRATPPGATPQYRRFQVAFQSAASASAFIESIRFICPCKANAPPPPPARIQQVPISQRRLNIHSSQVASAPQDIPPVQTSLRPSVSAMSIDEPPPATRRTATTVPPAPVPQSAVPHGSTASQTPSAYATHAHGSTQSAAPAYLSGPAMTGYAEPAMAGSTSSRPSSAASTSASSAAAHYSSSDPYSAPPVPAPIPSHSRFRMSAPAPTLDSNTNPFRPRQIHPPATALPHSGSSESSLPSSSFPRSSSPPAMGRLRPSSPDLMPPPPLPARESRVSGSGSDGLPATGSIVSESGLGTNGVAPIASPGTVLPGAPRATAAADILATLRDSEGVYGLSKDALESLVAEVIREEGFADLMRALDGMWKVKGMVGVR